MKFICQLSLSICYKIRTYFWREWYFMKQNRSTLYLILACLFALALPLFDYLEYIQFRQAQSTYQLGYLQFAIRPLILPMCSLFLGWFLVHFLGIQKTNRKIFFLLVAILIIYIIFISPWCLIPVLQLTLPCQIT